MGIILDLIILAIFILSVFVGYKKGLASAIFNLLAFAISLVITVILYTPISNGVINNTEFDDNIKNAIIENVTIETSEGENVEVDEENIISMYFQKYVTDNVAEITNELVEEEAGIIAEKIVRVCVAIVLFMVVRLAMILLKFVIGGAVNLPIIKQFDKLGGTIYGILVGLILIYIILTILFFIVSVNSNQTIINAIDSSFITKILYENNFILEAIL